MNGICGLRWYVFLLLGFYLKFLTLDETFFGQDMRLKLKININICSVFSNTWAEINFPIKLFFYSWGLSKKLFNLKNDYRKNLEGKIPALKVLVVKKKNLKHS